MFYDIFLLWFLEETVFHLQSYNVPQSLQLTPAILKGKMETLMQGLIEPTGKEKSGVKSGI